MTGKLITLIGIPASGKTKWAREDSHHEFPGAVVIESDEYRQRLYGDPSIQGDNSKLFAIIHADILALLERDQTVIFDASNLIVKNRLHLLQTVAKTKCYKMAIVFATQMKICQVRNSNRNRVVPAHVINRMRESFTCPQTQEGFDEIRISYDYDPADYVLQDLFAEMATFEQDNPHHSMTLGNHVLKVVDAIGTTNPMLYYAALLHDNGKRMTKVFRDARGNPSEIGHFYNHENCGAYEALFYLNEIGLSEEKIIYICNLIQFHMRPYDAKTDKAKAKLLGLVGERMYRDLLILNDADRNSK